MKKILRQVNKIPIMLILISFAILISISGVSAASTVYVNTTGSDSNLGTIDSPYLTIGKGVSSVDENGTVNIADGNYTGIGNNGITINKNMNITGQSQKGTIINGAGNTIFYVMPDVNVLIQNLTLANGTASYGGGAVYNYGNLTLKNCTFSNNTATGSGGGAIYNHCFGNVAVTSTVIDCTFINNTATYNGGGAIMNDDSTHNVNDDPGSITSTVINCTFINNTAYWGSGAIYNVCSGFNGFSSITSTVTGCTFINNTATYSGSGAITNQCYMNGGSSSIISNITNCTFNNNIAASSGGSIYNYCAVQSGSAFFTSIVNECTFAGNNAQSGGAVNTDCSVYSGFGSFISTVTNCTFTGNTVTISGGAIYNYRGSLTVENCTFSDNNAFYGGAIYNKDNLAVTNCTFSGSTAQYGGAIYNYGNLTLGNCTFAGNTAMSDGGAIYNERSTHIGNLTMENCNFSNNKATYSGGAVYNKGSLTMENCNFNANTANSYYGGGAIFNYRGSLTVENCTFSDNNAFYGGAIYNMDNLTVTNCTFSGNNADYGGSAILNSGGNCEINFNRIFGNTASYGGTILNDGGSVNAENNWWGSNNPDFSRLLFGDIDADPWVVLRLNNTSNLIGTGENSTLSVNLNYNSNGEDLMAVYGKSVPDVSVVFDAGSLGSLDPSSGVISSGLDTSTLFTAGSIPAVAAVNATVDGQRLSAIRIMDRNNLYVATAADGGNDSTGNGSPDSPFLTLNKAIAELRAGGRIHVANGLYNGSNNKGLTIDKNMTIFHDAWISGTGSSVIIDAEHSSNIFVINMGTTVLIQNLTLMNGISGFGGAIHNEGNLTTENCNFTGNRAGVVGGAIVNWYGTLNVTNCTFTGNIAIGDGGAIGNSGICAVTNSIFINNTARNGGAIFNYLDTLNVTRCTFNGNIATQGGALANVEGMSSVTGCNFISNNANLGGAIYNAGNYIVHFSRFYNNTAASGTAVYCDDGFVNAENNWWSSNANPMTVNNLIYGLVDADPWVILTVNATPTTINNTKISTITANFNHNMDRNGNRGTMMDHIPDGPVTLNVPWGSLIDSKQLGAYNTPAMYPCVMALNLGITHSITLNTIDGVIAAIFYANEGAVNPLFNPVKVTATADNYTTNNTESAYININKASDLYIKIKSNRKNPKVGQKFTITYKLGNKGPDSADNVTITIPLPEGFEITNISGDGTWTYNANTNTITWTMASVEVGDPYLYVLGKVTKAGTYVFGSSISSETYNIDSEGVTPVTINAVSQVKAASKTIKMQETGLPLTGLVLAVLAVLCGLATSKKEKLI